MSVLSLGTENRYNETSESPLGHKSVAEPDIITKH